MLGWWFLEVERSAHVCRRHYSVKTSRRKVSRNPENGLHVSQAILFICHLFEMKRGFVRNADSEWEERGWDHDFQRNLSSIIDLHSFRHWGLISEKIISLEWECELLKTLHFFKAKWSNCFLSIKKCRRNSSWSFILENGDRVIVIISVMGQYCQGSSPHHRNLGG